MLLAELAKARKASGVCSYEEASYEATVMTEQLNVRRLLRADDQAQSACASAPKKKNRSKTFVASKPNKTSSAERQKVLPKRRNGSSGFYPFGHKLRIWT